MSKTVKNQAPGENRQTRRGFLRGLLSGLAGAAGLAAVFGGRSSAVSLGGAADAQTPRRPAGTPIDNIFVPISSPKRLKKGGL